MLAIIHGMHPNHFFSSEKKAHGFTLIELLTVISILSVLIMLAAPSLQDFFIKNKIRRITDDFQLSIFKAKNISINKNTCTVMCMSSTTDNANPTCSTAGDDWQVGWIVFLNPSCDSSRNSPNEVNDLLEVRSSIGEEFLLKSQSSSPTRKIMFNARGNIPISSADEFDIIYKEVSNPKNEALSQNICLDALGRVRTIPHSNTCKNYK